LALQTILEIAAYGAWNGGTPIDNSIFENKGMFFKGNIPVNNKTIEERIGVRTRIAAPLDERIGVTALQDLLETSDIDPTRIKLVIGATNVGDDKYERGPQIKHSYEIIRKYCPDAMVLDLYAGCPGFNVAAELVFVQSLAGLLRKGDLSVVVGAENVHRAKAFPPKDTSNIIFGDDAIATALETKGDLRPSGKYSPSNRIEVSLDGDFISGIAKALFELNRQGKIDGFIVDNQLGLIQTRIPASAARIQHRLTEFMYPNEVSKGTFKRFKSALEYYDKYVNSFAFDIMTLGEDKSIVEKIALAYIKSGKYKTVASVYLTPDLNADIRIHRGYGYTFKRPETGIVDTLTKSHGCFADYIQVLLKDGIASAQMNGKGVFLHVTRSAEAHLVKLLSRNGLTINDIDMLIEHQANFAMIPMMLERLLVTQKKGNGDAVKDFVANKMITNIHERGNCSVVCMQRLPYDLSRGALKEDTIQGYPVNRNLSALRHAKIILCDSIGTGMTRSSFLQRI